MNDEAWAFFGQVVAILLGIFLAMNAVSNLIVWAQCGTDFTWATGPNGPVTCVRGGLDG